MCPGAVLERNVRFAKTRLEARKANGNRFILARFRMEERNFPGGVRASLARQMRQGTGRAFVAPSSPSLPPPMSV